ncbi:hypothetical protein D0864_07905, partial [Hortaea werneckii]
LLSAFQWPDLGPLLNEGQQCSRDASARTFDAIGRPVTALLAYVCSLIANHVLANHVLRGVGSADTHMLSLRASFDLHLHQHLTFPLFSKRQDFNQQHIGTTHQNNSQIKQIDKMFGWGEGQDHYDRVYNQDQGDEHEGRFSHELLAGGAAFGAMKLFEDEQRR